MRSRRPLVGCAAMKRYGGLFEKVCDFENLYAAYRRAARGKRYRQDVLDFSRNLERELLALQHELVTRTYRVSPYRTFTIYEPKPRQIAALPFRDRVVQWAVYRVIAPLLEARWIEHSFACRNGKGTLAAALQVQWWIRDHRLARGWYLKMDVAKYFESVPHDRLKAVLRRQIKDPGVLWLLDTIIDSGGQGGCGIPIGNLTSQLFANVYLNELDQYAKHDLKVRLWARYMDDIVVLHHKKEPLRTIRDAVQVFLVERLDLTLNAKTRIMPIRYGVDFVGKRIWAKKMRLRQSTVRRMRRRLKALRKLWGKRVISVDRLRSSVMSYYGLLRQADCRGLERKLFSRPFC